MALADIEKDQIIKDLEGFKHQLASLAASTHGTDTEQTRLLESVISYAERLAEELIIANEAREISRETVSGLKADSLISDRKLARKNRELLEEIENRKRIERHIQASNSVLRLMTSASGRKEYLTGIVELMREWTGCSCVGIRIRDTEGNVPYESCTGFETGFLEQENRLAIGRDNCICTRVIAGEAQALDERWMSPGGSFCVNDANELVGSLSEEERKRFRGVCIKSGFLSFAVVPLRDNGDVIGAIHLADKRAGMAARHVISFLEDLSPLIGEGFAKFSARDALKSHHEVIRQQSKKLDAFFEHSITPFVFLDTDFNFLRVNEAYAKCSARGIGEFSGRNHFELYPHAENEAIFRDVVKTKTPYRAMAKAFSFPDHPEWGVTYWDWTLAPILDEQGEVDFLVFSLEDVTERKRAEEEIESYVKKLERSNEDLQEFASVASHDLREPLRKVQSFGDMLGQKYRHTLGEEGQDYLARMIGASKRMDDLLRGLLHYSRVTTQANRLKPVDLNQVAQDAAGDLEVAIRQSGARVDIGRLPILEADEAQMRRLFQNLIGNAVKYRREDQSPHVKISAEVEGRLWRIAVEDNGIGFDEAHKERIFKPFQRLHGRSGPYEGTGMGLAICRKIVERHGGTITARSRPGEGSTFIFTLPMKQSAFEK